MCKNEEIMKDEFCKEMTGLSLKQIQLDKYLKSLLDDIIKKTSEKNLVGVVAIGNFEDSCNPLISTGGFFEDNASGIPSRGFITMRLVESFIRDLLQMNNDLSDELLELFINDLKNMIEHYESYFRKQNTKD